MIKKNDRIAKDRQKKNYDINLVASCFIQFIYCQKIKADMYKVYLRTADSKAISQNFEENVSYEKVVSAVHNRFKIPQELIKLVYNGENIQGDFKLNTSLPHHIIHVINTALVSQGQLNFSLTVNNGKVSHNIKNVKTKSDTKVKDFLDQLLDDKLKREHVVPQSIQLYHRGVRLSENQTFQDQAVEDNSNIIVRLENNYPDPSDVGLVSQTLANSVTPLVMGLQMMPKYMNLSSQITTLRNNNFFLHLQQRYEGYRPAVVFSEYSAYRFPASPTAEPDQLIGDEVIEE